jgi:hypothetical protein
LGLAAYQVPFKPLVVATLAGAIGRGRTLQVTYTGCRLNFYEHEVPGEIDIDLHGAL